MTVKELFLSVGFENVINALRNTHRTCRSIKSVASYKEAFDTICLTEFEGAGGEVSFDVTPREEWFEPHSLPLLANNVEGDFWKNTVGKTVVKPDDNPFTDAELAGAILWGMTFYGFTRHTGWTPREEHYTSYGEQAEKLKRRLYLPYIRNKLKKRKLKSKEEMPYGIAFPMEIWHQIHYGEKHQNRAKRKRFYRIKSRIAELKRLYKRQHLIDTIHKKCGFYDQQLENRIMKAGTINETWRDSHVADLSSRINYLEDLLMNYFPTLHDIFDGREELLIVAYTSDATPLAVEEEHHLRSMIQSFDKKPPITFIKGVDNEAKADIALQFIIISKTPINDDKND